MPIDSSIYQNMRGPDIAGALQEGMKMSDMIKQRRDQDAMREAYKAGNVVGPDGKTTFDPSLTASALAKGGYGKEAMELQSKADADKRSKLEDQFKQAGMIAQLTADVKDQASWDSAVSRAKTMGLDVSQVPAEYDPKVVSSLYGQALTVQDRLSKEKFEKQLENDRLNREEARNERRYLAGQSRQDRLDARADKLYERDQALATPFGQANTVDDAKQLKEAFEAKQNFDSKLNDMIALRKEYGGEAMNREAVARGKQLSKDLLLEYKNMAKLGVLSKADEDIINAIIPDDPLAFRSPLAAVQGQDPILSNLEKFKADKDQDFRTRVGTRTRAGVGSIANQSTERFKEYEGQRYEMVGDMWVPVGGKKSVAKRKD